MGRCCQEGCKSIARDQKLETDRREDLIRVGEARARFGL